AAGAPGSGLGGSGAGSARSTPGARPPGPGPDSPFSGPPPGRTRRGFTEGSRLSPGGRNQAASAAPVRSSVRASACRAAEVAPEIGSSWCGEYFFQKRSSGGLGATLVDMAGLAAGSGRETGYAFHDTRPVPRPQAAARYTLVTPGRRRSSFKMVARRPNSSGGEPMKLTWLPLALVPVLCAVPRGLACGQALKAPAVTRVSGPYTHANLSLYLLHGRDVVPGRKFLTLAEAIEQKKVVVNETGQVNQLTVENLSDGELFIMTGDIVKGGRQDRVLAF